MKKSKKLVPALLLISAVSLGLTGKPVKAQGIQAQEPKAPAAEALGAAPGSEAVLAKGIYLGGQSLGGMTESQAKAYMEIYMQSIADKDYMLYFAEPEPVEKEPVDIDDPFEDDADDPESHSEAAQKQEAGETEAAGTEDPSSEPSSGAAEDPTAPEEPEPLPEPKYTYSFPLSEFGLTWDLDSTIAGAATLGQTGKLIERYKLLMDLQADEVQLPITYSLDSDLIRSKVEAAAKDLYIKPVNASIRQHYLNGSDCEFIVTPDTLGQYVDVEATINAIMASFDSGIKSGLSAYGSFYQTEADITGEALRTIDASLGHFRSNFSPDENRGQNIIKAAGIIDGTLLMPGEVFYTDYTLDPTGKYSTKDGWLLDSVYSGGKVVEGSGGGVCQIATTLYNAVMRAELEVVKRQNHSMLVTYVDPSMDAALATGSKEFAFRNNRKTPVYIEARIDNYIGLVFVIWGHETRDPNRSVKFVSTTKEDGLYYQDLLDTYYYHPDQDFSHTELRTGSHHPKVRSRLYKEVYYNGELVSRELISTDTYNGTTAVYDVGTKDLLTNEKGEPLELDGSVVFDGREYANNYVFLKDLISSADGVPYKAKNGNYLLLTDHCYKTAYQGGTAAFPRTEYKLKTDSLGRYLLLEEIVLQDGSKLSETDPQFVLMSQVVTETVSNSKKIITKADGSYLLLSECKLDQNGNPMKDAGGNYIPAPVEEPTEEPTEEPAESSSEEDTPTESSPQEEPPAEETQPAA